MKNPLSAHSIIRTLHREMSQIYLFPLQQKTTFDLHGPGRRSQHDIQTVPGRSQCQGKDFLDLDGLTVND